MIQQSFKNVKYIHSNTKITHSYIMLLSIFSYLVISFLEFLILGNANILINSRLVIVVGITVVGYCSRYVVDM